MDIKKRIGILGGGQLGKMLAQAGSRWDLDIRILDKSPDQPAGKVVSKFVQGDFTDYETVLSFGQEVDVITIKIENVNTEALMVLEGQGKEVYPQPNVIDLIKDKGLQKEFYRKKKLPTSDFELYDSAREIKEDVFSGKLQLPFVQKSRTEGYDGRGIKVVKNHDDIGDLLQTKSVVESLVDIDKELAVIVARSVSGEVTIFPAVEMTFHPTANLVENLICPARVSEEVLLSMNNLGQQIIEAFDMVGVLAIEFFLSKDGALLINEVAPRPHNSGHHTIEGNVTSQYEQHLRAILGLPLGDTSLRSAAVMLNLLGEEGFSGLVKYNGLEECLKEKDVHIHIYGKKETRPFRKMGHMTILGTDVETALAMAEKVRMRLKVET